jgi:translation initiation factor 2B subunit (eIF-2B alpha/beta/delta family)
MATCQVAGAFDGSSHTALVFQAVACDTAWQQFALLIDELKQKSASL